MKTNNTNKTIIEATIKSALRVKLKILRFVVSLLTQRKKWKELEDTGLSEKSPST